LVKSIADASGTVLADATMKPIQGNMVDDKGVFTQIDRAGVFNIASNRGKDLVNAIIRIIIALAAAIALAFLLEYLDNSIRDERDANRILDLPVLGAIPKT
jgi:capsular polysaccharide biosynthesis protein